MSTTGNWPNQEAPAKALAAGRIARNNIADADLHEQGHRRDARRQWQQIEAIRTLHGDTLAHVLERSSESANEHASEAIYALRQEIAELEQRRIDQANRQNVTTSEYLVSLAAARDILRAAVEHEATRAGRRQTVPAWLTDARAHLDAAEVRF